MSYSYMHFGRVKLDFFNYNYRFPITSSIENLKQLQDQTGTACLMLTQPLDQLNQLAKKAVILKTTDDEAIKSRIPFSFVIVLGPQYTMRPLLVEMEMLIKSYLRILNNPIQSIEEISTEEFLNKCSSYL